MDVLAQRSELGVAPDPFLPLVLGLWTGVADPLDPVDPVEAAQQLRKGDPPLPRQSAAVVVDVLAEQGHLPDPVVSQPADLGKQPLGRPADLAAPGGGHDAVRAPRVAPDADLHPALELARSLGRQVPGEALELKVALSRQRIAGQEFGQLVHLTRPERDVDELKAGKDLLLDRLRPAAPNPDHPFGMLALEALGLAEVGDEAAVGGLSDRARVEQDQVGTRAAVGLYVTQRLEHPLHPLGIMLIHLTAERRQVVALHRGLGYRRAAVRSRGGLRSPTAGAKP